MIHNDIQSRALAELTQQHLINQSHINEFQETQSQILRSLCEHPDPSLFYYFLKTDSRIMQIRFIDLEGKASGKLYLV